MNNKIYELDKPYPTKLYNGNCLSNHYIDANTMNQQDLVDIIKTKFSQNGIVIIKNGNLNTASDIENWANIWGQETLAYAGGTNVRQSVGKSILTVGTEPPQMNVAAHNEMSYSFYDTYPKIFMLGCVCAPNKKGHTIFGDNVTITQALLNTEMGQKFLKHGVNYIRNYYNKNDKEQEKFGLHSWQDAFGTDDKNEVEKILSTINIDHFEFTSNDALRIKYHRPAFEWDDKTKMDLSFVSMGNHGYWFRNWEPFSKLKNFDRPHHLTYGNDIELTEEEIQEFSYLTINHSLEHHWEDNDLVILNNLRYTHARKPFRLEDNESRKIYVAMRKARKRHGIMANA